VKNSSTYEEWVEELGQMGKEESMLYFENVNLGDAF
jgi:hypothetical protein